MPVRALILSLIAVLTCTAHAPASQLSASSNPSAGSTNLAMQLRALETMNSTAGDSLAKSKERIEQMTEFIKSKGMWDAWEAYTAPPEHMPHAMSFEEALKVAVHHEQAMGPAEGANSPELNRQVKAYTDLARSTWEDYQGAMKTVARMSDFLNANGSFDDYHQWAGDMQQKKHEEMMASAKENAEENAQKQQALKEEADRNSKAAWAKIEEQHQQALKTAWQHHKFNSNQQLKYDKYAMKYKHGYWNNYGDGYGDCGYGYGW